MDYFELCHAMQSGVASKMNYAPADTEPKHLRVGVTSALVSNGALVQLLIEFMECEVKNYEAELSAHFGRDIKLV